MVNPLVRGIMMAYGIDAKHGIKPAIHVCRTWRSMPPLQKWRDRRDMDRRRLLSDFCGNPEEIFFGMK
jgi:hypothetical protein